MLKTFTQCQIKCIQGRPHGGLMCIKERFLKELEGGGGGFKLHT